MINRAEFIACLQQNRPLPYYDAEDLDDLALELLGKFQLVEARAAIELCEQTHPGYQDIKIAHARLIIGTGQNKEALELLEEMTACSFPYERDLLKIHCYLQEGQKKRAKTAIKQFLQTYEQECQPEDICLDLNDLCVDCKYQEGRLMVLQWGAERKPKHEQILIELSDAYNAMHDSKAESEILNRLIDIDALNATYWNHLAIAYGDQDLWEDALKATEYSLTLNPQAEPMIIHKAHCQYCLGRWKQAINSAQNYLDMISQNTEEQGTDSVRFSGMCLAKSMLIDCYNQLKMFDKARDTYNELLKVLT